MARDPNIGWTEKDISIKFAPVTIDNHGNLSIPAEYAGAYSVILEKAPESVKNQVKAYMQQ